jgi:hypothetical protein
MRLVSCNGVNTLGLHFNKVISVVAAAAVPRVCVFLPPAAYHSEPSAVAPLTVAATASSATSTTATAAAAAAAEGGAGALVTVLTAEDEEKEELMGRMEGMEEKARYGRVTTYEEYIEQQHTHRTAGHT